MSPIPTGKRHCSILGRGEPVGSRAELAPLTPWHVIAGPSRWDHEYPVSVIGIVLTRRRVCLISSKLGKPGRGGAWVHVGWADVDRPARRASIRTGPHALHEIVRVCFRMWSGPSPTILWDPGRIDLGIIQGDFQIEVHVDFFCQENSLAYWVYARMSSRLHESCCWCVPDSSRHGRPPASCRDRRD